MKFYGKNGKEYKSRMASILGRFEKKDTYNDGELEFIDLDNDEESAEFFGVENDNHFYGFHIDIDIDSNKVTIINGDGVEILNKSIDPVYTTRFHDIVIDDKVAVLRRISDIIILLIHDELKSE